MKKQILSSRGFTLIELLVVIGLLGALAGVVLVAMNPAGQLAKGHNAQRKSDVKQIQSALEFYRSDSSSYPASVTCGSALSYTSGSVTTTYISKVPCDPKSGSSYIYVSPSGNSTYCLRACLENANDPDRDENNPAYGNTNAPGASYTGCTISTACPATQPKTYTVLSP